MFLKLLVVATFLSHVLSNFGSMAEEDLGFIYEGFELANLGLDGTARVNHDGLLQLTNFTTVNQVGHAFYPDPVTFKNSTNGSVFSFSTTFVFGIVPEDGTRAGNGMAFVVAPQRGLPGGSPSQFLGLFNISSLDRASNRVFAVELDNIQNIEFGDIDGNHVGVDINGLRSVEAKPAGIYHPNNNPMTSFENLILDNGKKMQVWVDYDGVEKRINVTLAPMSEVLNKPSIPLISIPYDLSEVVNETGYVGFSAAVGSIISSYNVVGWSFKMNGQARALDPTKLPELPRGIVKKRTLKLVSVGVPVLSSCFGLITIMGLVYYVIRRRKYAELLEEWEIEYGPHRFKFKDLYIATKGFSEREVVGSGGFGKVYRGVLPKSMTEIAVKRVVSHEAAQGIREFVAEIVSVGRLHHLNLVSLLGYCRRKGELLLVYEYMPYGSLDKFLYNNPKVTLSWTQRFRVIKGVASGLFYLHEEWEQVVIHRDVKAGNVLIDAEINGRLGDFGLARLYDRGTEAHTTNLIGTLGYVAPEFMRTGRATTSTDVFAFGAFLLEVASGRRPVEIEGQETVVLVDWVFSCADRGTILEARDPNLGDDFVSGEVELVLRLELMCECTEAGARPSMRQVVEYLEGDVPLPEGTLSSGVPNGGVVQVRTANFAMPYQSSSSIDRTFSTTSSEEEAYLSVGR